MESHCSRRQEKGQGHVALFVLNTKLVQRWSEEKKSGDTKYTKQLGK